MRIAVTSASGQLGGAIIQQLKKDIGPDKVVGVARTPAKAEYLGVEVRKGDYSVASDFDEALKGMDAVMILSGNDEPQKRIQQHRNIIEGAKSNGLKKIVYTSIVGDPEATAFSPIIGSNRQTEKDIINSGLDWSIGRNGIYIEADLEYIDTYVKEGGISNCAGDGRCAYTSRSELAYAYSNMLLNDEHNGQVYHLLGEAISQAELASMINEVYGTDLVYKPMAVEDYLIERQQALGDFLGTIIAGIYEGIRNGSQAIQSDFEKAAHRPHCSPRELIEKFRQKNS